MNQSLSSNDEAEFVLWPGQKRLLEDYTKRYHAVVAGNRYGKTVFGARWALTRAILNKDSELGLIVAPKYDLLKQVNVPAFLAALEHSRIPYEVNMSELYVDLPWGQRVLFRSAETWRKIVGYTVAWFWLDEPGLCPEEVNRELTKRLSCPKAHVRQGLYTGTPEGINHYAKMFGPGVVERNGERHSESDNKLVLHGRTYDNPILPPDYVQDLLEAFGWNENLKKSYIDGEFCPLFERNCYELDSTKNLGDYPPNVDNALLDLAFDFNVGLVTWGAFQQAQGKHLLVSENPRHCRDTDQAIDQFESAFPSGKWGYHEITVTGDASGWAKDTRGGVNDYDIILERLRKKYKNVRVVAPRSNPSVTASIVATNRLLVKGLLCFDRRCAKHIESAQTTTFDGKGDISKPSGESWTHAMDDCRYYVDLRAPVRGREGVGLRW